MTITLYCDLKIAAADTTEAIKDYEQLLARDQSHDDVAALTGKWFYP